MNQNNKYQKCNIIGFSHTHTKKKYAKDIWTGSQKEQTAQPNPHWHTRQQHYTEGTEGSLAHWRCSGKQNHAFLSSNLKVTFKYTHSKQAVHNTKEHRPPALFLRNPTIRMVKTGNHKASGNPLGSQTKKLKNNCHSAGGVLKWCNHWEKQMLPPQVNLSSLASNHPTI